MLPSTGPSASLDVQIEWLQSLRVKTAFIEFTFNDGRDEHALISRLAHLDSTRSIGVRPGNGYSRSRPSAIKHRFAYDREIVRALIELGGFFSDAAAAEPWTALGDVDVVFLDEHGAVLGATVAHERMIITP